MRPEAGKPGAPPTVLNVSGPYREPREPSLSYDISFQRSQWPTAQAARVKVSIAEELDHFKINVLQVSGGTPGQQLRVNQLLTRQIAEQKFKIAEEEGMLSQRLDVMLDPFTGPLAHLFPRLAAWMEAAKEQMRREIQEKVGL